MITITTWALMVALLVFTTPANAQPYECDIEDIRGTYQPQIPGQSSECVFEVMPLAEPWVVQTRLTCPGTPATTNGAVYQLDEEGHCALHIGQDISGVLIPEEGEEIYEGAIFGLVLPGVSSPDEVCRQSSHLWMNYPMISAEAVNNTPGAEGTNVVELFNCIGVMDHKWGPMETSAGSAVGRIRIVGVSKPAYQPAEGTLRGALRSNGANPPDFEGVVRHAPTFEPVTITLERGELPY